MISRCSTMLGKYFSTRAEGASMAASLRWAVAYWWAQQLRGEKSRRARAHSAMVAGQGASGPLTKKRG